MSFKRQLSDRMMTVILIAAVSLVSLVLTGMLALLFLHAVNFFRQVSFLEFFTGTVWNPLFTEKQFGVLPLITGTCSVALIAAVVSVVPGLLISIYLSEYATDVFREVFKVMLEIFAGIPTVVFGFLALFWATPVLQNIVPGLPAFSAFTVGVMTGLMILPILVYLWESTISSVPDKYRNASLALGAGRLQTLFRAILPTAFPGLLSGFLLVMIRVVGEAMIVVIAGGQQAEFGFDFLSPVQTMTSFIIQVCMGDLTPDSMEYEGAFAVAAMLVMITGLLGLLARHFRKVFTKRIQGQ